MRKLMDAGIKMSLGTDVSGGFQHGVLTAIRDASVASKVLDAPHLSLETLFYLATLGGAEVCCLEDKIGNFLPGKEFDALCVQTGSSSSTGASDVAPPTQLAGFQGQVQSLNPLSQDANPSLFAEESDTVEKRFAKCRQLSLLLCAGPQTLADASVVVSFQSYSQGTIEILGRSLCAVGSCHARRRSNVV